MIPQSMTRSRALVLPVPALPKLQKLTERIREEPERPYRLEELAREYGFSKRDLMRQFQKELGMSFSAYLQIARVTRAAELLTQPGASVSQTALEVGYSSLSAFSDVFNALLGLRPSAYLRQSRILNDGTR